MIEVPISIVAWVSVVLVQAIIHYVVFGARRERIQQEEEAVLEESLSLSTNESFMEAELEPSTAEHPPSDPSSPTLSSSPTFTVEDVHVLTSSPRSAIIRHRSSSSSSMLDETMIFEPSPFYLTQTGTEILKVRNRATYSLILESIFGDVKIRFLSTIAHGCISHLQGCSIENMIEEQIRAVPQ
jgi:hypothetical protein